MNTIFIVMGNYADYEGSWRWPVVAHSDWGEANVKAEELAAQAQLLDEAWAAYRTNVNKNDEWDLVQYRALRTNEERQVVLTERARLLEVQNVEQERLTKEHPDPNFRLGDGISYSVEPIELL